MFNFTLNISSRVPFIFNGSNILQTHASAKLTATSLNDLGRQVANIAATASVPSQPNSALIRTLAQMPMYMTENREEWNVRNESAGFTICIIPYSEPYVGPGRRYDLKVVAKTGYLTCAGSSVRFNEMTVDIIANSPKHLSERIEEFCSGIVPFYAMSSGLCKDTIQDMMDMRAEQLKALAGFAEMNSPEACWIRHPMIENYKDAFMEISLTYRGEM